MESGGTLALLAGIAHLAYSVAAMALFGASLFPFYAGLIGWPPPWTRLLPLTIATAMLVSMATIVLLTLFDITGDVSSLTSISEYRSLLLETSFGPVLLARLGFSAAAFMLALGVAITPALSEVRCRKRDALFVVLSGGALAALAMSGHAFAALEGTLRVVAIGGEAVHLLAAGAWVGALPCLLYYLTPSGAGEDHSASRVLPMLQRFSAFAQYAVGLLVLGGVAVLAALNSVWLISATRLENTAWGLTLLAKLSLLTIMLTVAGLNRFILMPRLMRGGSVSALSRSILFECFLGAIIIAAATVLGRQAPPA